MTKSNNERPARLPSVFYNSITLAGTALSGVSLGLIVILMALEVLSTSHNQYVGIIAFIVLPVFLILGLMLVVIGVVRQQKRRRLGQTSTERLPLIDLNQPAHLRATVIIGMGTIVLLMFTAFGSFKAYEYTESDEFCGTMCHEVMKPEYTAYQDSPHARVGCVKCHIGPGAQWFVKSKMSGAYQLYSVAFDKFSRPIETPVHSLRPSRDTCEQCHWPAHFSGEKMVIHDYYASEEGNDHWRLHLLMKIGGGGSGGAPAHGSHWHVSEDVEVSYISTDRQREEIPWVKLTMSDGTQKVFRDTEADLEDSELAAHESRLMDCIDCHNRPSHHYDPPSRLVNRAMSAGLIADDLPDIKSLLVELMEASYDTEDEALAAINSGVSNYYTEEYESLVTTRKQDIDTAILQAQKIFRTNLFPEMKTDWRSFPDHIGHLHVDGCFRCHDGNHVTDSGEVISRDCNICHTIVAQERLDGETVVSLASIEYQHPEDIDGEWKTSNCSECHGE